MHKSREPALNKYEAAHTHRKTNVHGRMHPHAHTHLVCAAPFLQIISVKEWRDLGAFFFLPPPCLSFSFALPPLPLPSHSTFLLVYSFLSVSPSMPECKVRITKGTPGKHGCGPPLLIVTHTPSHAPPPFLPLLTPLSERRSQEWQTRLSAVGGKRKRRRSPPTTTSTHSLHPSPPSPARLSHARKCYSDQELHVHVPLNQ